MAATYGAISRDFPDQEQNVPEVIDVKSAPSTTGRWFSVSVVALLVTACVLLVAGSSSSSSVVSWVRGSDARLVKYTPLALHKTSEDEETTVDTAIWSSIGTWSENGLGSGYWSAFGGTFDLSTLYVTDTSGNLKVSTNGGSSFTSSTPFTYTYGGSTAAYTINQVAVAGSSGSTAYVSTKYSYVYGGGNTAGKIFKTTNSGSSWSEVVPSKSSNYINYNGVATSSDGKYVLAIDDTATYTAYVSSNYGSSFSASYALNWAYLFRACAVSSSGQYMYLVSDSYLFIHSSYGSTSGWGYTYYPGLTSSASANKISVSSLGDKLIAVGINVVYSTNYGASLTTLYPTDTTYSHLYSYKIVDAQISPDGSTVAVIQQGTPNYGGKNEAYIRYTSNPSSGSSASWTTLSLGRPYGNLWFINAFKFNTDGSKIVAVAPTSGYYDAYYRYYTKQGSGWTGTTSGTPTAAPTQDNNNITSQTPSAVPTHNPPPSAKPSFSPTNKPVADTPAPTGAQISGYFVGRNIFSQPLYHIASTSAGALFTAYQQGGGGTWGDIYGSLDAGATFATQTLTKSTTAIGCGSYYVSALKAAYSSSMSKNIVWFTCGPYSIRNAYSRWAIPYFRVNSCTGSRFFSNQWTCQSSSQPLSNFNSGFISVGVTAVSSDGTTFAVAGSQGSLLIFKGTYSSNTISMIDSMWNDMGTTTFGNNKYGGLAWSSDGAYLLVAPQNGLNLWYFTVPSTCFSSRMCTLSSLTATTSPSLPASGSGATGTWSSCAALTDNNYMACTQFGGFTYFSTNSGVSWSKVGSQTTFIKTLAMYYASTSGKACLAGINSYGSPYLMTHQNGQSTTEWSSQKIGDSYWGWGYRDVAVTSCSNIYATAISFTGDKNILVTSGTFGSDANSPDTFSDPTDDASTDTTDNNWTWGTLTSSSDTAYSAIAASSDSIYMYAAFTNSTIGVSSDGGASWTTASDPGTADWSDMSCSSNGQYVTVVSYAGDVWTSMDFGATWASEIILDKDTYISVAVSSDGSIVFVGGNNGAYLSGDFGDTYESIGTSNYIYSNSTYGFNVAASSDGSALIAASAFGGVLSSTDSGETWAFYSANQTFSSVKYANNVIYGASVEDGLYSSTDNGATWTMFDAAPQAQDWNTIAVSSDGTFIAAAAPYERISVSEDGGATWGTIGDGDIWTDLVFVSDGKVLLATSEGKTSINQAIYSDSSSSSKSKKSSSKKSSSKKSSSK